MSRIRFEALGEITQEVIDAFSKWEDDPALVYLNRPNKDQTDLERKSVLTHDELAKRKEHETIYLIVDGEKLIGAMDYKIDPHYLYKQEKGTAWVGITIGEETARGKGIGLMAMQFLEDEIRKAGYKRIELGVFEFNEIAHKLYKKAGYLDIGRIPDFTFWQGKMWGDIRMEKRF
jgi:RimJ/RimL family protein N-acetyltransferase